MVLGGKWWPLGNVRADECKGCEDDVPCSGWQDWGADVFQVVLQALGWGEAAGSKRGCAGGTEPGSSWWLHGQTQDGVT